MQIDGRRAFAAPKKKLDVSLRPKERRAEEPLGSEAKAGRVGEQAEQHFLVNLRLAHDASPANSLPASLKLRLDQCHQVGAR